MKKAEQKLIFRDESFLIFYVQKFCDVEVDGWIAILYKFIFYYKNTYTLTRNLD